MNLHSIRKIISSQELVLSFLTMQFNSCYWLGVSIRISKSDAVDTTWHGSFNSCTFL